MIIRKIKGKYIMNIQFECNACMSTTNPKCFFFERFERFVLGERFEKFVLGEVCWSRGDLLDVDINYMG